MVKLRDAAHQKIISKLYINVNFEYCKRVSQFNAQCNIAQFNMAQCPQVKRYTDMLESLNLLQHQ